ncbi:Ada metal-binding domain-containing protein [Microbulbifer sp. JTAC008]|uniref:Ada metal-binding domain-containing protein n=1 Tax=unclassified Microbulbifer TaxID=2619833 RepID=UPI0040394287
MKIDAAVCYSARLARDRRFDGRFYTAVKTTNRSRHPQNKKHKTPTLLGHDSWVSYFLFLTIYGCPGLFTIGSKISSGKHIFQLCDGMV